MPRITLKVRNLEKNYGKENVIRNLSFELHEGDIVGLIGENGSGKTTTLSMIAGIKIPSNGDIYVCGISVNEKKDEYFQNLSVAFDEMPFYPYLSGEANLFQASKSESDISHILRMCDLYESRKKLVSSYSLGMRQKLNIARALLKQAKVFIMDEPFNGLDPKALSEFKENVKGEIQRRNATLLISSHALKELMYFCNRYLFIKNGAIFADVLSNDEKIEHATSYVEVPVNYLEHETVLNGFLYKNGTYIPSLNRVYFCNRESRTEIDGFKVKDLQPGQTVLENIYMAMSML